MKPMKPSQTLKPLACEFIGAWRLIEYSVVPLSSSTKHHPLGTRPEGLIIYEQHFMAVHIAGNPLATTAIARHPVAYTGHYTYDERNAVITHHIQLSTYDAWANTDQCRHISIEGNRLQLRSVHPIIQDDQAVHATLVWEKQA